MLGNETRAFRDEYGPKVGRSMPRSTFVERVLRGAVSPQQVYKWERRGVEPRTATKIVVRRRMELYRRKHEPTSAAA